MIAFCMFTFFQKNTQPNKSKEPTDFTASQLALLYSIVSFAGIEQQFLRLGIIGKDRLRSCNKMLTFPISWNLPLPCGYLLRFFLTQRLFSELLIWSAFWRFFQ